MPSAVALRCFRLRVFLTYILGVYLLLRFTRVRKLYTYGFFLQVVIASKAWTLLPSALRPDRNSLFSVLLNSRANSTAKKYINEIKKFFVWCRSRKIPVQIPFSAPVVALYLFNLDQQLRSPASMVLVHAALKWLHSFTPDDSPNPLDNACCRSMIECAKRTRSQPVSKKKPVDPDVVKSIIDRFGAEGASLKDLRIAAVTSLGFAGFFRFNELINIQPNHIFFHEQFVKVFVPKSKTDVYREGNYAYISKLESNYCPVAVLRRYIQAADIDLSSQLPLFRPLTKNKLGYTLRNGKLSYTRCREIFKDALKDVGYDPKDYGLHSLRSGGITSVVSNDLSHNVSERLLKLHGRWKSDEAKDMYVLEPECSRLRVTKYLGI